MLLFLNLFKRLSLTAQGPSTEILSLVQILNLVCFCNREAEGNLNAPRLARSTIFAIFEVLCENLKPNLKHGNPFTAASF